MIFAMSALRLWLVICSASLILSAQTSALDQAREKTKAGDFAGAIAILEAAIGAHPKSGEQSYLMLADCYAQVHSSSGAVQALRSGLKAYPGSPLIERNLGELLLRLGYNDPEAGTLLADASRALPKDPEVKHYYAQWAFLNQKDGICAEQEDQALNSPGLNDLALLQIETLLGMCQDRLEHEEAARKAYARAHDINSRQARYDPVATLQYVRFLTRYREDAEAERLVDEILAHAADFGPAHVEKAKFYDRKGDSEHAIQEAEQALHSGGTDDNDERAAHSLLARCYFRLGHTEEANREQQWISEHPNPETPRK